MRPTKPVPPTQRRRPSEAPRRQSVPRREPTPPPVPPPVEVVAPPAEPPSVPAELPPRPALATRPRHREHLLGLAVLLMVLVPAYVASQHLSPDDASTVAESTDTTLDSRFDAQAIRAHIEDVALRYRVSPRLVVAVISVESEFNPRAVSRKGARGLMQLMPATASSLSVEDSFDPMENIEAGVRHLRRLIDRFDNDLPLALAAYNAGERAVIVHRGIPPYRETRRYVVRVLHLVDPELARAFVRDYLRRPAPVDRARARARILDDPSASAKPVVLDVRADDNERVGERVGRWSADRPPTLVRPSSEAP